MAQIVALTLDESAYTGFTQKITLTSADIILLTSGAAASIYPTFQGASNCPAGTYIQDVIANVKTVFAGGAGTLVFTVTDGTNTYIAASTDLKTAGYTGYNLTKPVMMTGATQLQITVTAGTSILGWTSGELHIYVNLANIPVLDR